MIIFIAIMCGFIIGWLYFIQFEQFKPESLPEKCWSVLHYLNKNGSPLYIVHLKSILTGIILILAVLFKWNAVIVFLASCIIGLHIGQLISERNLIMSVSKDKIKQDRNGM